MKVLILSNLIPFYNIKTLSKSDFITKLISILQMRKIDINKYLISDCLGVDSLGRKCRMIGITKEKLRSLCHSLDVYYIKHNIDKVDCSKQNNVLVVWKILKQALKDFDLINDERVVNNGRLGREVIKKIKFDNPKRNRKVLLISQMVKFCDCKTLNANEVIWYLKGFFTHKGLNENDFLTKNCKALDGRGVARPMLGITRENLKKLINILKMNYLNVKIRKERYKQYSKRNKVNAMAIIYRMLKHCNALFYRCEIVVPYEEYKRRDL